MGIWGECSNCIWYDTDQCDKRTDNNDNDYSLDTGCSYSPVIEEVSDEEAMLLVKEGSKEYYDAWNSYKRNFYFDHIKYVI